MGIKGLKAVIKKHVPEAISEIDLSCLKGTTVCIDSSILLYKCRYTYKGDNFHILGFLHKTIELLEYNIKMIYVFDGKPPQAKNETINKRKIQNNKLKEQLATLRSQKKSESVNDDAFIDSDNEEHEIDEKIKLLEKNIKTVTRQHSLEVMEMLKSIGIPFFACDGEADEMCVYLQKNGYADYILTEDTDSLAFGGKKVLFGGKNGSFRLYCLDTILKGLQFSQDEFIDFCILCGCDYTCTIPKVGPVTALKLIKQNKMIENIKEYTIPESFDYLVARGLFKANKETSLDFNVRVDKTRFVEIVLRWNIQPDYFLNKLNLKTFQFI